VFVSERTRPRVSAYRVIIVLRLVSQIYLSVMRYVNTARRSYVLLKRSTRKCVSYEPKTWNVRPRLLRPTRTESVGRCAKFVKGTRLAFFPSRRPFVDDNWTTTNPNYSPPRNVYCSHVLSSSTTPSTTNRGQGTRGRVANGFRSHRLRFTVPGVPFQTRCPNRNNKQPARLDLDGK